MARRRGRKKRKITAWNRKFGATAKACFRATESFGNFGTCMRKELKR